MQSNALRASAMAVALSFVVASNGTSRAQVADCDFDQGLLDLYFQLAFSECIGCASEFPLVGWGIELHSSDGTLVSTGTTGDDGFTRWDSNGGRTNVCGPAGAYVLTFSLPSPNPYPPEVNFPDAPYSHNYTVTEDGVLIPEQVLTLNINCYCDLDGDSCTSDRCVAAVCTYETQSFLYEEPELCNDRDDDCDGATDEGLPDNDMCFDEQWIGCSDLTREGFQAWHDYPLIAACGGAWSVPGFAARTCDFDGGNHGDDADGAGCSAKDLCGLGWHVCYGPDDVAARLGSGDCGDVIDAGYPNLGSGAPDGVSVPPGATFFVTAARGDASCSDGVGAPSGASGVFGCGNLGLATTCGPLDRAGGALCGGLRDAGSGAGDHPATDYGYAAPAEWAWSCGATGQPLKSQPHAQGGVLCCKDSDPTLPEACDAIDNDLDALTDEVAFGGGSPIEVGSACREGAQCGTLRCTSAGGWECAERGACTADATCDDVDDDGDGATDEDFAGGETECGVGACKATGTSACVDGAIVDTCAPAAKAEASDVTCDGIDGDCDGDEDEEFVAGPNSCGLGVCASSGTATCIFGGLIDTCEPKAPRAESDTTCDGTDDDCDGSDDEDVPSTPTTCGSGACAGTGAMACVNGAMTDTCRPSGPTSDATCDDVDDDCDGATDEDHDAAATTCGVGACAGNVGSRTCSGGSEVDSCDPGAGAGAETCNAIDDDCDGATDEELECGTAEPDPDPEVVETNGEGSSDDSGGCHGGLDVSALGVALALIIRLGRRARR